MPITATPYTAVYGPLSLPGVTCALWMDGADTTTMTTSGTTITRMNDKSGNGYNSTTIGGTPALTANALNGLSAISFNGSSYILGPNANTTTTGTFFVIASLASGQGAGQQFTNVYAFSRPLNGTSCGSEAQSICGLACANAATSLALFPQRNTFNGPTFTAPNYNTAFMHTAVINGTTMAGYGNGSSLGTISSSGNFGYTFYNIGSQTYQLSGILSQNYYWTGYVGELIAFNNALSDPQRQQIEGYLAQKWGLTASLPPGHPGLTQTLYNGRVYQSRIPLSLQATYYLNFNPVTIPNCLIWFDAADSTKLSLTGTTVNSWTSKASFTGSATSPSGTVISGTITQNSLNVIRFSSQSSLSFTLAEPNQARAWFSVVRLTTPQINNGGQVASIISQTTNGIGQESITAPCYPISGGFAMAITQTGVADIVKTPFSLPDYTNIWCVYSWVNSATSTSSNALTINGTLQTLATSSLASNYITSSYTKTIGSSLASAYVGFDVGEILMYNGEITTPQRQLVESYLAQKWGLQGSLPPGNINNTAPAGLPPWESTVTRGITRLTAITATGGTIVTANGFRTHTFTTVGTTNFVVTQALQTGTTVQVLIVAGGGSGSGDRAAGGGAGGLIFTTTSVTQGTYAAVVGAGGTVGTGNVHGTDGSNSSFNGQVAIGGGSGGSHYQGAYIGNTGGSGGGGAAPGPGTPTAAGGTGTSGQGYGGGTGYYNGSICSAGGGGGAGGTGSNATTSGGGNGGPGVFITIGGITGYYAAGGGGAAAQDYGAAIGGRSGSTATWTPIINVLSNCTLTGTGPYTYYKSAGLSDGTYDTAVYSTYGFTSNILLSFSVYSTGGTNNKMIGFSTNQLAGGNYTNVQYGFYLDAGSNIYSDEGGTLTNIGNTYTTSTVFMLTYDGTNMKYYKDGTVLRTVAVSSGSTYYLNSGMVWIGNGFQNVYFGGGGNADQTSTTAATPGIANTGSGGAGAGNSTWNTNATNGGSGIVIISYPYP